jgi:hypothetical protein
MGEVDWVDVDQGRDKLLLLVTVLMNFQVA